MLNLKTFCKYCKSPTDGRDAHESCIQEMETAKNQEPDYYEVICLMCKEDMHEDKGTSQLTTLEGDYRGYANFVCDDNIGEGLWAVEDAGTICQWCYESIDSYGSVVKIFYNDQENSIVFIDGIVKDGRAYDTDDFEPFTEEIIALVKGNTYIQTDGWRGYRETQNTDMVEIRGFTLLSYHHTEQQEKYRYYKIIDKLNELDIPLFVVFNKTSNIFAVNMEYFVRPEDVDKLPAELVE